MNREEQDAQKALIKHLKIRAVRGLVYWHTPNGAYLGGKRSRKGVSIQGSIMKGLGVRAGVSDLILVHGGKIYCLELKKAKDGRPRLEQIDFLGDMERAGAFTAMPAGLDAALATLESWGLLKGRAA